jgi:glycosyltransferase 2 family protein
MALKLKSFLQNSISIIIAFLFLYLAFRNTRFSELWESLSAANYWWVLLLFPIAILSHWVRAVRWGYLLKPVKEHCSDRNLFSGVMIGYAVNNILPRVGEFVRPVVLGNLEGISRSAALGSVVLERILDLMTFYFLVCVVMFLYPHSLDPLMGNSEALRPLFLIGSVGALVFFLVLFFKAEQATRWLIRMGRFLPERHRPRLERLLGSFAAGLGVARMREHFGAVLFYSFLIWGLYALGMYEPFFAFGPIAAKGLTLGDGVLLLVVSSIAWVLPAPGAMGTYHSFVTVTLVKLYGFDVATALSYSIITHEVGYVAVMVLGAWYYWQDRRTLTGFSFGSMNGKDA